MYVMDLVLQGMLQESLLSHPSTQRQSWCGQASPACVCACVRAGTASPCSLWQRIGVMQVMRRLCADAYFLHFLYVTYDAKEVQTTPPPHLPPASPQNVAKDCITCHSIYGKVLSSVL